MSDRAGKWGYTHDDEVYYGRFDTPEEAAAEGLMDRDSVTVGQYANPRPAEEAIDARFIEYLVMVVCERIPEHYGFDFCADWPDCTKEEWEDLAESFRKAFGDWLDKHNLRPTWGVVAEGTDQTITRQQLEASSKLPLGSPQDAG